MVNWSEIDTVLLDMDGTLLDLHFDNFFWLEHLPQRYATHHGIEEDAARKLLIKLSEELHGSLNWYCIDYWSDATKMDVMSLKREAAHLIRFRPDTEEFLKFLQAQNKTPVILTNAHPKALALKLESSGLGHYINDHISAHQFKLAKENEGFWAKLQNHSAFDYDRCLFIDDNINVLRCARSEGLIHTLQMLHPDTTKGPNPRSEFPGILHFSEVMQ